MAMKKFVILLNGDLTVTTRLTGQIAGARVVAADGGMRHADRLGVVPECWIGDFDSSDLDLVKKWQDIPRHTFPAEKNQTDGEIAVDFVRKKEVSEIIMVGGLSSQLDHSLCHVLQLISLEKEDVKCFATDGIQEAWPLVAGSTRWSFPEGATLSVLGLSDLENLNLSGVK
ncbi:MAG TPA: thiamine diphosphokinase, partial [Rhizobiales bacterium]|nr:thiamine diphosphokinase [Hyphomicrobiales bacterium]